MTGDEYNHINDVIEDLYEKGNCTEEDYDFLCIIVDKADRYDKYKWHDLRENPDDLPEEHDSIFAKYKNTNTWRNSMFKKTSDEVLVCFEFDDGTRIIKQRATRDGEFVFDVYCKRTEILPKAIAWREIKPFEEEESDGKSDT